MSETDFYTVVHKQVRRALFDLSLRLGAVRAESFSEDRAALAGIAAMLRGHGHHEDVSMAPLLEAGVLERAHQALEEQLAAVERLADGAGRLSGDAFEGAALELYRAWNRFVAAYLLHLDDEERELFAALGSQRGEVAAVAGMVRERGADGIAYLRHLLPLLSHRECVAILRALDEAPSQKEPALQAADAVLSPTASRSLRDALK